MRTRRLVLLGIFALFAVAAGVAPAAPLPLASTVRSTAMGGQPEETARVGVWNIEKLSPNAQRGFPELQGGDALQPRTNEQLRAMGKYIRDTLKVRALVVTEIEATSEQPEPRSSQLDVVVSEMGPTWKYHLGRSGGDMRIGLVFDTRFVKVKKQAEFQVKPFTVQGEDIFDRDPLVNWVSFLGPGGVERNDALLVGLHLKSQQQNVDNHLVAMAKFVTELRAFQVANGINSGERDVLLMGDLNDSAHRRTGFRFLFDYLEAKGFVHLRPDSGPYPGTRVNGSQIDHLFASEDLAEAELSVGSFIAHTTTNTGVYRRDLSDHFPVSTALRVLADDD